jgi:methylmalonyl-CoA mutase, C-terminal domain
VASDRRTRMRVVIAKPGLDGHDRGAKVIARALRDAGHEVIYTGLHQTPAQIVEATLQEDADVVGLSILSGAHLPLATAVVERLRAEGADDVHVIVGGTIPEEDATTLRQAGIAGIFGPGTSLTALVGFVEGLIPAKT